MAGSRWRRSLRGGGWVPVSEARAAVSPLHTEPRRGPLFTERDCSLRHGEAELGTQGRAPLSRLRVGTLCVKGVQNPFLPCFDI